MTRIAADVLTVVLALGALLAAMWLAGQLVPAGANDIAGVLVFAAIIAVECGAMLLWIRARPHQGER
jgi:hypothetical protein